MGEMNAAQLHYVEVMCESLLHGMYTVLTMVVIWLLMTPRPMPAIHKIMFGAGIVMWMLASAHLGLVIQQVTNVVTPLRNAQAQVSIATIQLMIGDMVLIWRVWAVWGRNYWVTIIPMMLMLAAAGVRFAVVASIAGVLAFSSDVSSELIVANTLLSTFLIAGRIWYLQWRTKKLLGRAPSRKSRSAYRGIVMMIIETGALYALSQIIAVILDKAHSPGIHAVLDMIIPLIGILPTLLVLAVHCDLVPGTHASESYNNAVSSEIPIYKASGDATSGSSTLNGTVSRKTEVWLATESTNMNDGTDLTVYKASII